MFSVSLATCSERRARVSRLVAGAFLLAGGLVSRPADAQTTQWPVQHVDRDLVVPRFTLRIDGGPRWPLPSGQVSHSVNRDWDDSLVLRAGVSFGVIDDLELGIVQPLQVFPDGDLQNPMFHGTYQFVRGPVDVGVFWGVVIPYEGHLVLRGGIPLYAHLSDRVRLDFGGFLRMEMGDDPTVDLEVPFYVPINVTPQVFLGPEVAMITWGGFENVVVPVGFFVGYTVVTGGGALGDFSGRVRQRDIRSDRAFDQLEFIFAADLFFDL